MEEDMDDTSSPASQTSSGTFLSLSMDTEMKIAAFYEQHPMYYDLGHNDYKNRDKRNAVLKEFADSIGIPPEKLKKRFTSNRTDHMKLWNQQKKAKICGTKHRFTPLQKFKLAAYKFLQAYYKPRPSAAQASGITYSEDSDDARDMEPEEDQDASRSDADFVEVKIEPTEAEAETQSLWSFMTTPATITPKCAGRKIKKARKQQREVVDELNGLLQVPQQEHNKDAANKFDNMAGMQVSDRDAWGHWLLSVHNDIPVEHWREYQKESFLLAQRYLMMGTRSEHSQPLLQQSVQGQQGLIILPRPVPPTSFGEITNQQNPSYPVSAPLPTEHVESDGSPLFP